MEPGTESISIADAVRYPLSGVITAYDKGEIKYPFALFWTEIKGVWAVDAENISIKQQTVK